MFSQVFLAVTAHEMASVLPQRTAYMACHFSAGGVGLSNRPKTLPEGSILLLDDSMPVQGHDPTVVATQLKELADRFSLWAILLDFQRPVTPEACKMAAAITKTCPCAITPAYAERLSCPVFLPPPPVNKSLSAYLQPWKSRGIYLEIAPEVMKIAVTPEGSHSTAAGTTSPLPLVDERLHCHYGIKLFPGKAVFTLARTGTDLAGLIQEAEALGVLGCIGLYQELDRLATGL